jgi:hypothetical protein
MRTAFGGSTECPNWEAALSFRAVVVTDNETDPKAPGGAHASRTGRYHDRSPYGSELRTGRRAI